MDVEGLLGYSGEHLVFINDHQYAFISGNGICIFDINKGPRDIVWRSNDGIYKIISHIRSNRMVVIPLKDDTYINIISLSTLHGNSTDNDKYSAKLDNPTNARIINACFSYNGNRLYALTDDNDPKLLCWDMLNNKLLIAFDLSVPYTSISVNPIDDNKVMLYCNDNLAFCTINDITFQLSVVLDTYSINDVTSITTRSNSYNIDHDSEVMHQNKLSNTITMTHWTNNNTLLVGNILGHLYIVDPYTHTSKYLTKVYSHAKVSGGISSGHHNHRKHAAVTATYAIQSINNIIIGTSDGTLNWYAASSLVMHTASSGNSSTAIDTHNYSINPVQVASTEGKITTIAIDPAYNVLYTGVQHGQIYKFPVYIVEKEASADDNDIDIDVNQKSKATIEVIKPLQSIHFQVGQVLCTTSFAINMANGGYSSVFVTGAQEGMLTLWRQPSCDSEPLEVGRHEVRRSLPRNVKLVTSITVVDTVLSLGSISYDEKVLLFVGLSNGSFEVHEVTEAVDADEDGGEDNNKGDDDEMPLNLLHNTVSKLVLYDKGISLIAVYEDTTDNNRCYVCVASHRSSIVYILAQNSDGMYDVYMLFKLQNDALPTSLVWQKMNVFVGTSAGILACFSIDRAIASTYTNLTDSFYEPHKAWTVCTSVINQVAVTNDSTLLLSCLDHVSLMQVKLDTGFIEATALSTSSSVDGSSSSDYVICISSSPNGKYIAAGCADGSICVWDKTMTLQCSISIHSDAVISIVFSRDSSMILTVGTDGSKFITSVTAATALKLKPYDKDMSCIFDSNTLVSYNPDNVDSTGTGKWLDQRNQQYLSILKREYSEKTRTIVSSVSDISNRINTMIEKNHTRDTLERMSTDEFVVDVDGRDALLVDRVSVVDTAKNKYEERSLANELLAARIRSSVWDTMEAQACKLLPILLKDEAATLCEVSSFSIKRMSDVEKQMYEKMRLLRCIEMKAQIGNTSIGMCQKLPNGQYKTCWKSSVDGCPTDVSWIHNDGIRWPSGNIINVLIEELDRKHAGDRKDTIDIASGVPIGDDDDDNGSINSIDGMTSNAVDDTDVCNLIYPPQAVRTPIQKRIQIELLKQVVQLIRRKFNECFDKLRMEKDDVLASIDSRNARIQVIIDELQLMDEQLLSFKLHMHELPGYEVTVDETLIVSKRYDTAEETAAKIAEEERKQREADSSKEDTKGRALIDMMNGTLEGKKDTSLDATAMYRPEWMLTTARSDMSEAQLKEADAYEAKLKVMQEEHVKYRKALEIEVKKLKADIIDTCKAYDDKLTALSRLKVAVQREVYTQEVYMSRLALNTVTRHQTYKSLIAIDKSIVGNRTKAAAIHALVTRFNQTVQEVKVSMSNATDEEKALDKMFKRDLQTLCDTTFDQDAMKVFTQLYRKRSYPVIDDDASVGDIDNDDSDLLTSNAANKTSKSTSAASKSKGASANQSQSKQQQQKSSNNNSKAQSKMRKSKGKAINRSDSSTGVNLGPMQQAAAALAAAKTEANPCIENDPYHIAIVSKDMYAKRMEAEIPILSPLSLESDCPDGFNVDQFTWVQLQDLRTQKIRKEIESKTLQVKYNELKQKLDTLKREENAINDTINTLMNERHDILTTLTQLDNEVTVVVCILQGQDEVDRGAAVTSYAHGMLLPTSIVQKFNKRIDEIGNDKIAVLTHIKEFRRKINQIDWEVAHLQLQAKHYEEYFTDLQLLRVTRELQSVLHAGANESTQRKERLDRIIARKELTVRNYVDRISKLRKEKMVLQKSLNERVKEVSSLQLQISELNAQVIERKRVKQSRDDARGSTGDRQGLAIRKMRKIVGRKHLVDTAKAQAEEIDQLRMELDRVRQKTFPSFIRKPVTYPDDR